MVVIAVTVGGFLVFLLAMALLPELADRIESSRRCASPCSPKSYERCRGARDKRCRGGNCTAHCREHCGAQCMPKPNERKLKLVK